MLRCLFVALLLLVTLQGTVKHTEASATYAYCMSTVEGQFLTLINNLRAEHGVPRLSTSQTLGAAAEHHSIDMGRYNYFGHTLHNGTTWSQNITNHGYPKATYRGENIAAGNPWALQTFNQFYNSPGHLDNMLNARWRAIGIGRIYNGSARYVWYWTTTFGDTRDGSAIVC